MKTYRIYLDGTGITPGTEKCKCADDCEMPCWQRLGIGPPCAQCGCDKAGMTTGYKS